MLLHIGTNDMGVDITGVDTRLEHLLGSIAAAAPAAHVFVATIIPAASATKQANILEYNEMVVDATARAGSRFHLVHMHEALNNTTDLADGLHPNATGYDKMAAVWYDALRSTAGVSAERLHPRGRSGMTVRNPGRRALLYGGPAIAAGAVVLAGSPAAAATADVVSPKDFGAVGDGAPTTPRQSTGASRRAGRSTSAARRTPT